jgi:hypothetical protein
MTITPSTFSKDALGVELLPENAKTLDDAFALGAPSHIRWIGKGRSGLTLKCCIAALWAVFHLSVQSKERPFRVVMLSLNPRATQQALRYLLLGTRLDNEVCKDSQMEIWFSHDAVIHFMRPCQDMCGMTISCLIEENKLINEKQAYRLVPSGKRIMAFNEEILK